MKEYYYDATIYVGLDNTEHRLGVGVKPPRGKEHYTCLRALMGNVMEHCFIASTINGTKEFQVYVEEYGPDGWISRWSFDIRESEVSHYA